MDLDSHIVVVLCVFRSSRGPEKVHEPLCLSALPAKMGVLKADLNNQVIKMGEWGFSGIWAGRTTGRQAEATKLFIYSNK